MAELLKIKSEAEEFQKEYFLRNKYVSHVWLRFIQLGKTIVAVVEQFGSQNQTITLPEMSAMRYACVG